MRKYCSNCYYYFTCSENQLCEDYTPCVEIDEEREIEAFIESERAEFYADWVRYIEENEED